MTLNSTKWAAMTALSLIWTAPAFAQSANGEEVASENEIVVTGQKRDENLQDVPSAVSVLSGDALADQAIGQLDDLQTATPGLSITDSGLTQSVNIRGIGLASGSPNAANGVATYFDGVFQPPIVSTNSFYDIGSIEVFRGPQGTFVGSNSTGGAIFINSRNPELGNFNGYFQGELGSFDRAGMEGALNIPLGDTLAIRVAGNYRTRDSFYSNSNGLRAPGNLDEQSGRVGLLWEPSDQFSALLKAEVADKSTGGYAYRPIVGTRYASARTNDIYTLNYDDETRNDEQAQQYTARLEYVTSGGITVRSVSGYQNKEINNFYDSDGTNANTALQPRSNQSQFVRERVWTQELNIISPDDQPLRWIMGGYYQKNRILVDISVNPAAFIAPDIDIKNKKITTGLFAQVSYDVTPQLSIDVGARYSKYKVDAAGQVRLRTINVVIGDPGGHEKDDQLTGKFALNWKPNDNHLVYAFVAKGYKSGGIQSPTTTFKPETVIDYELGWKGTFADGAVTTQLGAFYYDYKNFQLDALNPASGLSSLINLTDATVKGLEGQLQGQFGGLRIFGGFAYTDSSLASTRFVDTRAVAFVYPGFSNVPPCAAGQTPSPTPPYNCIVYNDFVSDTGGGANLYSPKWTYNLGAEYRLELGDLAIIPRVNYSHLGSRYTYIGYDPVRDRLPAYDLINASIGFESGRFGFDVWATNLTKEEYISGQNDTNEFYGAPREYGVRMSVDF